MKIYRIKDWDELYENNRTRGMKIMQWIPVPNMQDGDGYITLVERKNGAAYLGAWLAILQVASKCKVRGTLLRNGTEPHTPDTLSRIARISPEIIESALEILVNECKWLEIIEQHEGAGDAQFARSLPAVCPHPTDEEGKGIEEKEEKGAPQAPEVVFPENLDCPEFHEAWGKWNQYRSERRLPKLVPTSIQAQLNKLGAIGPPRAIAAIEHSISNNYQGIFEPKAPIGARPQRRGPNI